MKKEMGKSVVFVITALAAVVIAAALMLYFGVIHINNPGKGEFPVRGVDVSSYQGEIDWNELSKQKIDFAYIKATEGSSHVDPYFLDNWNNSKETKLCIGAYHFFSFESAGEDQAKNVIGTVDKRDNMLPIVIDVEYYGNFKTESDIDVSKIKKELRSMIDCLAEKYGTKPVIYVSSDTYNTIVKDEFTDCPLWYRSVYTSVPKDIDWTFWQYSNRHVLSGYKGKEKFIDMNTFKGTKEELLSMCLKESDSDNEETTSEQSTSEAAEAASEVEESASEATELASEETSDTTKEVEEGKEYSFYGWYNELLEESTYVSFEVDEADDGIEYEGSISVETTGKQRKFIKANPYEEFKVTGVYSKDGSYPRFKMTNIETADDYLKDMESAGEDPLKDLVADDILEKFRASRPVRNPDSISDEARALGHWVQKTIGKVGFPGDIKEKGESIGRSYEFRFGTDVSNNFDNNIPSMYSVYYTLKDYYNSGGKNNKEYYDDLIIDNEDLGNGKPETIDHMYSDLQEFISMCNSLIRER